MGDSFLGSSWNQNARGYVEILSIEENVRHKQLVRAVITERERPRVRSVNGNGDQQARRKEKWDRHPAVILKGKMPVQSAKTVRQ